MTWIEVSRGPLGGGRIARFRRTVFLTLLMTSAIQAAPIGSAAAQVQPGAIVACLSGDSDTDEQAALNELVVLCTIALDDQDLEAGLRSEFLITRGVALRNAGELDRSLADLDEAVQLDPASGRASRMRGWTLRNMGRLAAAEREYGRALEIEEHWQAYLSRCVVRIQLKRADTALDDCEAALSRRRNADALYFTARLYDGRGDHARAITLLEEARRTIDAEVRVFLQLSMSYDSVGNEAAAREALEDGLARYPGNQILEGYLAVLEAD